jgi:hypothetical protein
MSHQCLSLGVEEGTEHSLLRECAVRQFDQRDSRFMKEKEPRLVQLTTTPKHSRFMKETSGVTCLMSRASNMSHLMRLEFHERADMNQQKGKRR